MLYEFRGNMRLTAPDAGDNREDIFMGSKETKKKEDDDSGDEEITPLNEKNLLMRGVTIRNTHKAYALVTYAGKSTDRKSVV